MVPHITGKWIYSEDDGDDDNRRGEVLAKLDEITKTTICSRIRYYLGISLS